MVDQGIVILGGRGMLGTDLALECQKQGTEALVLDLPEFDITNEQHLKGVIEDAQVIINCAAYTNVEKAESQAELAHQVNAAAVGRLGDYAKKNNTWVLHVSTDFVFDGKLDRPYIEIDAANPINVYGESKLAGEKLLIESGCRNCIVRVEWTYGLGGNNFISKLASLAKAGKDLNVVDDQIGSPTATAEVAKVICDLVQKRCEGIFHFVGSGYVSRFEMAKFIFDKLGIDAKLSNCKTSDYACAAARPLNSRFNCSKIEAVLDKEIEPWQGPLENFLRQL